MPINDRDWASVYEVIERENRKRGETLLVSKVIKRNTTDKLVWITELGDQPIPIIAFDYEVKYYDTTSTGTVVEKMAKVTPVVPAVGDLILVAMERGANRLPRCLGKVYSKNYIVSTLDDS
jgi:hypothetical protein